MSPSRKQGSSICQRIAVERPRETVLLLAVLRALGPLAPLILGTPFGNRERLRRHRAPRREHVAQCSRRGHHWRVPAVEHRAASAAGFDHLMLIALPWHRQAIRAAGASEVVLPVGAGDPDVRRRRWSRRGPGGARLAGWPRTLSEARGATARASEGHRAQPVRSPAWGVWSGAGGNSIPVREGRECRRRWHWRGSAHRCAVGLRYHHRCRHRRRRGPWRATRWRCPASNRVVAAR